MMAAIRAKDTKPEMIVRRGLHRLGFRYRLHDRKLPGRPDLVFPKYRAVIFVNGCFWHGHDCKYFRMPTSSPEFWESKINGNRKRDGDTRRALRKLGIRNITVWECEIRDKGDDEIRSVVDSCAEWLKALEG